MYDTIEKAVEECLGKIGLAHCKRNAQVVRCSNLNISNVGGSGVYVFYDERQIYYVGEANDVKRRLGSEHCKVHIGGSEGVVRFLMYLLNKDFCNGLPQDWQTMNAKEREDYVKEHILKPFINKLNIYVLTCDQLKNPSSKQVNPKRKKLEECLIEKLKPILNPP